MKGRTVTRMHNHARRWLRPAAILFLASADAALGQGGLPANGHPTPIPHNEQGQTVQPAMPAGVAHIPTLRITSPVCYANCDRSTAPPVLNVADFACFLNAFAAAEPSANCDGSTAQPVLNVMDFACFLNRFTAGCS